MCSGHCKWHHELRIGCYLCGTLLQKIALTTEVARGVGMEGIERRYEKQGLGTIAGGCAHIVIQLHQEYIIIYLKHLQGCSLNKDIRSKRSCGKSKIWE